MKAVYFNEHGGPEVLKYGDLDDPAPGRGGVLIDVEATSINHLDIFVRRGMPGIEIPFPHVPGCDAAGRISKLGEGVSGLSVGQRVLVNPSISCGRCEYCLRGDASLCRSYQVLGEHRWGGCCEKVVVPSENVIPIPDELTWEQAAAVPLVFLTAWRMLITRGRLKPGEDVLILGAAAGVGTACIQVAKVAGARVLAAASGEEKLALCKELGADVLIDYTREDVVERVREITRKRGVDICVDYIGKDTWVDSLRSTSRGGRIVTCGATTGYDPRTDLRHIYYRQLEIIGSTMGSKNELLAPLKFIFDGRMKPVIGKVLHLENTADGHRLIEDRRALGKVVVRVRGD